MLTDEYAYLVQGSAGVDDDYREWPVRVFLSKPRAELYCQRCQEYVAGRPRWTPPSQPWADWGAFIAARRAFMAAHPFDPAYEGHDLSIAEYRVLDVPFELAQVDLTLLAGV